MPTTVKNVAFLHTHSNLKKQNSSLDNDSKMKIKLETSLEKMNTSTNQNNSGLDLKIVCESP